MQLLLNSLGWYLNLSNVLLVLVFEQIWFSRIMNVVTTEAWLGLYNWAIKSQPQIFE